MRAFEQAHGAAFDEAAVNLVEQVIRGDQLFVRDFPRRQIGLLRFSANVFEEFFQRSPTSRRLAMSFMKIRL